jgi:pSer/pThr/pTyr-binding forkhead associated (FHA) protein
MACQAADNRALNDLNSQERNLYMASLIVTSGEKTGDYYPLGQRTNVIGRDEGVPIQLIDEHISRKHLQIRYEKEKNQYLALDMKSRHGVFINGNRIHQEVPLKDDDKIDLGNLTLLFTTRDFPDRQSALAYHKKVGERARGTLLE